MTGKLLAGFILALLLPGSASAALVTWVFEGEVSEVQSWGTTLETLSSLGVEAGSPFSGLLVFESTTPDTYVDADDDPYAWGDYLGAITTFDITIGSLQHVLPPDAPENDIDVVPALGQVLAYGQGSGDHSLLVDPWLILYLRATPWVYPTSDDLPLEPPDVSALLNEFQIEVTGNDGSILGTLTRLEAVPEPSLFLLLVPYALAMRFHRRSQP